MALDPKFVRLRLRSAALKFRCSRGGRWLILGLAASLAFLLLFLLGDIFFHFGAVGRWIAFVSITVSFLAGAALSIPAFLKRVSDEGMARRIENSCSNARNILINAVQFDRELAVDSPVRAALFHEMNDPFPGVRWGEVFDFNLLRKLFLFFSGIAAVLVISGLCMPAYFSNSAERLLMPSSKIDPLTLTKILEVSPGNTDVPNGSRVALSVKLGGTIPRVAHLVYREHGAGWQTELLDHDSGTSQFEYVWKEVREPIEYYLKAGDVESDIYRIRVRPKTLLKGGSGEMIPPAFTGLPKLTLKDLSSLQNIAPGSKVTLSIEFNNPLSELMVADGKNAHFSVTEIDSRHWQITGVVSASEPLKLNYKDDQGVADNDSIQLTVKAVAAPKIVISSPPEGTQVFSKRDETLTIRFTVTHDYGI